MIASATIRRPVLRYHGGKFRLAAWLISYFPPHRIYVEPFGGAASVLLQKQRAYAEVYNDLDEDIGNVFAVLQSQVMSTELERLLRLTPYSRREFELAYTMVTDPVERARRTIIRSFMGFGSASATYETATSRGFRSIGVTSISGETTPTGFRANSNRSGTVPAHDWMTYPDMIRAFRERLQGVTLECRHAIDVIQHQDTPATLHYCDPPYPRSTRSSPGKQYRHEMTDTEHRDLAATLHAAQGMVVLSGYACDLYDRDLYSDWHRIARAAHADGARKRTEVLWLSPATVERLNQLHIPFEQ